MALGVQDLQLFPWHTRHDPHIHAGMTLLQPKGYLTQSTRACVSGRSNISEHSSVRGRIKREKYRTRLSWWLHLRDGVTAQLLLYIQMWGLGKKWSKTIKMLTIPAPVPSCLLSPPCLNIWAFVWIPKAGKWPRNFRDIIHSRECRRRHLSWISNTCICKICMSSLQSRINCKNEQFQ